MMWTLLAIVLTVLGADDSYYSTDQSQQISREHRFVFVHVPKTGGTSFERSKVFDDARQFHQIGGHWTIGAMMAGVSRDRGPLSTFTTFSIIRHPCSRFVSAFNYLTKGGNSGDKKWAAKNIGNSTLEEFVQKLDLHQWSFAKHELHLKPQHMQLFYPNGTFGVGLLMCQEGWDVGMDRLLSVRPDMKGLLPATTHALEMHHEACAALNPETRSHIEKFYALDYCIFNFPSSPSEIDTKKCGQLSQAEYSIRRKDCLFYQSLFQSKKIKQTTLMLTKALDDTVTSSFI